MIDIKILIVDDSKTDHAMIRSILEDYNLISAYDGIEAMEMLQNNPDTDIMILDLNMPRMNGFEVLEVMQNHPVYKDIATLILTNYDETENEIRGLDLGALDYIRKPINMQSLRKRIEIHTNLRNARLRLEEYNATLEIAVQERTNALRITRDVSIHALVSLLEVRDIESSNHTRRTQSIMKELCEHLSTKEHYRNILTATYIKELYDTAPLHDIGKVGIPDNILLKPGPLNHEEFEIMKRHTTYGVEALKYEKSSFPVVSFLETAIEIAGCHHEKYDGSGYPHQLKGENIPLPGRLMAIIDVYDAIISKRIYKPPYDHDKALQFLTENKGILFDPDIVDAFLEIKENIKVISDTFKPH